MRTHRTPRRAESADVLYGYVSSLREFVGSEVLYPQTGLLKMKSTRGARQHVPEKFLQVQKMWGTAFLVHSGAFDVGESCAWCNGTSGGSAGGQPQKCALCQIPWHAPCSVRACESWVSSSSAGPRVKCVALPSCFLAGSAVQDPLCKLCSTFAR